MVIKLLVWCCVVVGLATAAWIAWSSWAAQRAFDQRLPARFKQVEDNQKIMVSQLHDSYFVIGAGKFALRVYPRWWASVLVFLGITCIVIGLTFVMNIRHSHSMR